MSIFTSRSQNKKEQQYMISPHTHHTPPPPPPQKNKQNKTKTWLSSHGGGGGGGARALILICHGGYFFVVMADLVPNEHLPCLVVVPKLWELGLQLAMRHPIVLFFFVFFFSNVDVYMSRDGAKIP